MMRSWILGLPLACACASDQPHAVTVAQESPKPVTTSSGTLLAPPVATHGRNACVMLYECGCNASCTEVDRSLVDLSPGMQVGVTSGPLKGTKVFVAKNQTDTGESVLTVQRADPKDPIMVCGTPRSSMIGYLCSTKDSGHARACTTCE